MFLFPVPPPISYNIVDVSPTISSDGIFHHGRPTCSHKFIAKMSKAIPRKLSDPVAMPQDLDPRFMDRLLNQEKKGFVDPPGADDGKVFETLNLMPKSKMTHSASQCSSSFFPRSKQYELWYVRDRWRKEAEKLIATMVEPQETEKIDKTATNGEACHYLTPPFWWGGEVTRSKSLPVGNIDEYAYKKLQESQQDSRKISERLQMDHPKKYIPGVIHQIKNPEDSSMKDVLDKADSFKVKLRLDDEVPKNGPSADICSHPIKKPMTLVQRDAKLKDDARDADKTLYDTDRRWQPVYDQIGFAETDMEIQTELRKLSKPFSHELHKWYSENKPTQFMLPVKWTGKRPIPEMNFSHF